MFDNYPQTFGTYELLAKIGQGGMAEIFRAQTHGPNGFAKEVAIKRILPSLAHNNDFVTQFLDEARIAGSLSHPNIVQIFDVGQVQDDYYIAMEYVDGKHLGQVIRQTIDTVKNFPVHIAICIINEVAKALSFAHEARDTMGNPLHIIHRDISPQNILISMQGPVKLTDFGIAKAANRLYQTTAGVIKGKFSYLAPEQLTGAPASPQSDLFALGVVLWEMLAGRRLFQANSDIQTIQMVQACRIPPLSGIRNDVPPEVEQTIHYLLTPRADQRYQRASDLIHALNSLLMSWRITETLNAVSNFMGSIYQGTPNPNAAGLPATAINVPAISQDALNQYAPVGANSTSTPAPQVHAGGAVQEVETRLLPQYDLSELSSESAPSPSLSTPTPANANAYIGSESQAPTEPKPVAIPRQSPQAAEELSPQTESKKKSSVGLFIAIFLVLLCLGGGLGYLYLQNQKQAELGSETNNAMEKASIDIDITPPNAKVFLNGTPVPGEGKSRQIPNLVGGIKYQLRASLPGYQTQTRGFVAQDGSSFMLRIRLKPEATKAPNTKKVEPKKEESKAATNKKGAKAKPSSRRPKSRRRKSRRRR